MSDNPKRGQILIVVVLTLIVALTVGLSLASRTVLNLRLSRQSEESQRAFQAAEAGIEQIIQSNATSSSDDLSNRASFKTEVSHPSGRSFLLNGGELVDQDVGVDVWLSNYPNFANPVTTNLRIWWTTDNQTKCGPRDSNTKAETIKPGIEVVILSGNLLLPTSQKYFFEAGCTNRITGVTPTAGIDAGAAPPDNTSIHFNYITPPNSINITKGLIMRVIPVFNSTKINISSSVDLPDQGTVVQSTGKAGDTARKIQYFASFPQIPVEIFPYSILSQ